MLGEVISHETAAAPHKRDRTTVVITCQPVLSEDEQRQAGELPNLGWDRTSCRRASGRTHHLSINSSLFIFAAAAQLPMSWSAQPVSAPPISIPRARAVCDPTRWRTTRTQLLLLILRTDEIISWERELDKEPAEQVTPDAVPPSKRGEGAPTRRVQPGREA
jgi:hypothetical protein